MKTSKAELAQKINKLKNVVPKRTTSAVLQGILVQNGYLIANNMEMTVKAKIEGAEGETFIIPMKAFDLISNLPDGEVEIIPQENSTILIKAEKIKNKYQTMNPDTFPVNTEVDGDGNEITIKSESLLTSIKRVSYSIASNATNSMMTALCLQASGGTLNFVGMDGHVLAWDKVDYDGDFKLLIPKSTVDKLQTIGMVGEVQVKHSKTSAAFITEDYEIYTRIIEGDYYKYDSVFKELPLHTIVAKAELLDAMIRAKMCTDEKCPVRFEISNNDLNISIKDTTTDYHETVVLQEEIAEPLTIGFNAQLVLETLKAFDCENVGIQLAGPKSPMIVEAEDSDFKAVVLPVSIK